MESNSRERNVLLGLTSGIGIVKSPRIVTLLRNAGCNVRVVMTPAARKMASARAFEAVSSNPVGEKLFDRSSPTEVQHVSWAKWADGMLIAPATANTLGKLACGIADNLLTTLFLALDRPVMAVPAMNTRMYQHPAVQANLERLRQMGVHVMEPASGRLACGDVGMGRMPEPEQIVEAFLPLMGGAKLLDGVRILITAGPTREAIDPVRFISNRSSGKMGFALAEQARDMGADVTLVSGPVALQDPVGVDTVHVTTAMDMFSEVMERAPGQQVIIGCAAVSDYMPAQSVLQKMPKSEELDIRLVRTPDIMKAAAQQTDCLVVGFAAQTSDLLAYAEKKLRAKDLDMIVANDVSGSESGMESDFNEVAVLRPDGSVRRFGRALKQQIAQNILAEIAETLKDRN